MRFGSVKTAGGVFLTDNNRKLLFKIPNNDYRQKLLKDLNKMSGLKNATYEEIYDRISLITQNGKKIFTEEQFVEKLQEYFR